MSSRARWTLIALIGLATTPAVGSAQASNRPSSITVTTSAPKAKAGEQVAAVLVEAGYVLDDASATVVKTTPRVMKNVWALQIRANMLAVDSLRTRVVLTGVYDIICCGMLRQSHLVVEESRSGVSGKMWEELSRLADRVRTALPAATDSVNRGR